MKAVTGYEMYRWPEFKALCARLGIPWELRTTSLVIEVPCDGVVSVRHEYQGQQPADKPLAVDTTTLHNETFRTEQAVRREG